MAPLVADEAPPDDLALAEAGDLRCSMVASSAAGGAAPGLWRGSGASMIAMRGPPQWPEPDARVEHGVGDVGQQVEDDGEERTVTTKNAITRFGS
jgi:hypothetical protein